MSGGRGRLSFSEIAVVVVELLVAFWAFAGALGMLTAPDGRNLSMTTQALQGTPFDDYLIPGLILLVAVGIFPAIVAIAALRRRPWVGWAHLAVGCTLVGWITVQVVLIGYLSVLQPIFGGLGLVIAALALVVISRPSAAQGL